MHVVCMYVWCLVCVNEYVHMFFFLNEYHKVVYRRGKVMESYTDFKTDSEELTIMVLSCLVNNSEKYKMSCIKKNV